MGTRERGRTVESRFNYYRLLLDCYLLNVAAGFDDFKLGSVSDVIRHQGSPILVISAVLDGLLSDTLQAPRLAKSLVWFNVVGESETKDGYDY